MKTNKKAQKAQAELNKIFEAAKKIDADIVAAQADIDQATAQDGAALAQAALDGAPAPKATAVDTSKLSRLQAAHRDLAARWGSALEAARTAHLAAQKENLAELQTEFLGANQNIVDLQARLDQAKQDAVAIERDIAATAQNIEQTQDFLDHPVAVVRGTPDEIEGMLDDETFTASNAQVRELVAGWRAGHMVHDAGRGMDRRVYPGNVCVFYNWRTGAVLRSDILHVNSEHGNSLTIGRTITLNGREIAIEGIRRKLSKSAA